MANSVITSVAQKLKITCFRGEKFKLVINVKDSSGSNYDFTNGSTTDSTDTTAVDAVRMVIYNNDGFAQVSNSSATSAPTPPGEDEDPITFDASINGLFTTNSVTEDGKITIEVDDYLRLWEGTYKYYIYTTKSNNPNEQTYWLYGDLVVKQITSSPVYWPDDTSV
jgi:hypothetical protein